VTPDERARAAEERDWYHTIELAPGVVTKGWFDTRAVAPSLPWPDLTGRRCLDVGTFDGFWAFEMERRGAAEVLAVDVPDPSQWDWPAGSEEEARRAIGSRKGAGDGFLIVKDALGSEVERRELSVYDLSPAAVGLFDFVYVGSLLVHLRDPVGALEAVHSICAPSARLLLVDGIDFALSALSRRPAAFLDGRGRPWWWKANAAGIARMVEAAGFHIESRPQRVWMKAGAGQRAGAGRAGLRHLASAQGREALLWLTAGDPHVAILARPV